MTWHNKASCTAGPCPNLELPRADNTNVMHPWKLAPMVHQVHQPGDGPTILVINQSGSCPTMPENPSKSFWFVSTSTHAPCLDSTLYNNVWSVYFELLVNKYCYFCPLRRIFHQNYSQYLPNIWYFLHIPIAKMLLRYFGLKKRNLLYTFPHILPLYDKHNHRFFPFVSVWSMESVTTQCEALFNMHMLVQQYTIHILSS